MAEFTLEQQRALARARARAAAAAAQPAQEQTVTDAQPTPAPVQAAPSAQRPARAPIGMEMLVPGYSTNAPAMAQAGASVGPVARQMGREMALEAGAATAGQAAGALGGPLAPVTIPTFGGIAALSANIINQRNRKDQKGVNVGEAISAFIAGVLPGATMAKGGGKVVAKMVQPVAKEVAVNLAAAEAQSIIDRGKPLSPSEAGMIATASLVGSGLAAKLDDSVALRAINNQRVASAPQQKFIEKAVKDGYQIWPSASKFSATRAFAERAANPKKMQLEMAAHNFEKAVGDVREELGMFVDGVPMPITKESIGAVRENYNRVYGEIGKKTGMEDSVREITTLRHDADVNWKRFEAAEMRAEADVAQRYKDAFSNLSNKADEVERKVLEKANAVDPGLADKFLDTRKRYAKSYALEFAIDPVMGFEPAKLARWQSLRAGQELTDKMGQIADMSSKFGDIMMGPQGIYKLQSSLRDQALSIPHLAGPALRPALRSNLIQGAASSLPYKLRFNTPNAYTAPGTEAILQASRAAGRQVPLNSYMTPGQSGPSLESVSRGYRNATEPKRQL